MNGWRWSFGGLVVVALLVAAVAGDAQEPRVYRVGVILQGGSYSDAVTGLRLGLRQLGLEDGKHVVFLVHDVRGDLKAVEAAARTLESERVDLIYSLATSVTLATKAATTSAPIVFYAGTDPVAFGLVASFRKPGGRLTGIHGRFTELTAKRLELLKEMIPRLRRVVTFYTAHNPAAQESMKSGRDAARRLKVDLVERPIASVDELRAGLHALRPGEVDAFFYVSDAMITSQAQLIIEIAHAKKLPTMFADTGSAAKGALAAYGVNYAAIGRLSARHVHRVLAGASPAELPIEQLDRLYAAVNLKTARTLGLTIPKGVLLRADEVFE
jgi:putative tryptophan/tyrosine transport system substrate-binding protein